MERFSRKANVKSGGHKLEREGSGWNTKDSQEGVTAMWRCVGHSAARTKHLVATKWQTRVEHLEERERGVVSPEPMIVREALGGGTA